LPQRGGVTLGDVVGVSAGVGDAAPPGLEGGNANVADGDADGEGLGVGVGVGGGGIMFSQWCSGTVAPPISSTSFWQRAWSFSRSGGPNGLSAVPGNTK